MGERDEMAADWLADRDEVEVDALAERDDQVGDILAEREGKDCPWPTCDGRCAKRYHFCSRCASERHVALWTGEVKGRAVTDEERDLLLSRPWYRNYNLGGVEW